jgi:RHS repeat-associated protein
MGANDLDGLSADQRIATVTAQTRQGSEDSTDKTIGEVSHDGSLVAGGGISLATGGAFALVAFGAAVAGGMGGAWLAQKLHVGDHLADAIDSAGVNLGGGTIHRIATGGPQAATVGHNVAHSCALGGFLAAIAVGVAIFAVVAAVAVTGGAALVVMAAAGAATGFVGAALVSACSQVGTVTGAILKGSSNVWINGKAAARMTDMAACSKESAPVPIIEGCQHIIVNGLPLARVGHKLACGATVDDGEAHVIANSSTASCGVPKPDIPLGLQIAADWIGVFMMARAAGRSTATESTLTEGENPAAGKTCASDPVDVATGEFVEWRTDLAIGGVLPLSLQRSYASNRASPVASLFGERWSDSFSVCIVRKDNTPGTLTYWDDEGVGLVFDTPARQLNARHLNAPNLLLQGTQDAPVLLDRTSGIAKHFAWQGNVARLSSIEDAYGNQYRFQYTQQRLHRIDHSDGHHVTLRWIDQTGSTSRLAGIWLHQHGYEAIELVRYEFDPQGRLAASQSQQSGKLYYRYDAQDRITQWGDATHTHVTLTYRQDGRVSEVTTPGGIHGGRFEYDPAERRTWVWIDGQASRYDYNADNLVTCIVNPLGHTTHTTWDDCKRKTSETDPRGRVTRYDYDGDGRLARVVDPRRRKTLLKYDDAGRLTVLTLPDGRAQKWEHDTGGRILCATAADGTITQNAFDRSGRLVSSTATSGAVTRYEYNQNGVPCASIAINGARKQWQQDLLGRVAEITDAGNQTTRYQYARLQAADTTPDAQPQAPWAGCHTAPHAVRLPTGDTIGYGYNREGLIERVTDAAGGVRRYEYGAYDLLAAFTDQNGQITRYAYDSHARLRSIVNAHGDEWRFVYDAAGQLAEETDFDGKTTHYRYDAVGRLLQKTVADFLKTDYRWDEHERLSEIVAGTARIVYAYDEHDRLLSAVRHIGSEIESELRWEYDKLGRVAKAWQDGKEIGWEYDAIGRCIARHTHAGSSVQTHDLFGLLDSLRTPQGNVFIGRDLLGRETMRSNAPLHTAQRPQTAPDLPTPDAQFSLQQQYDPLGRLQAQQIGSALHTAAPSRHYHWQQGRLTGIDDSRFGSVQYTVDARNQILRADYEQGAAGQAAQENFAYDALGNVAVRDTVAPHQLHSVGKSIAQRYSGGKVTQCGNVQYRHDPAGRMIERTEMQNGFRAQTWEFTWDGFDRMVGAKTPKGDVWRYTYDAFGRRTGKRCVHFGQAQRRLGRVQQEAYLWDGPTLAVQWKTYADGSNEAPASKADSGLRSETLAWHHHPGSFAPLAVCYQRNESEPELLHIVTDHLGTPREAVKNDGEVVWAAQLQTWGGVNRQWSKRRGIPSGAFAYANYHPDAVAANDAYIDLDLRLPNQWEDQETGLFYNCQRYYDPATGQYVSSDPIGLAGGLRAHGYVHNPTTWMDPLGLAGCSQVDTPYGPAIQDTGAEAMAARVKVENGATLYRTGTMGKSQAGEAQFWALESPTSPGYAARYGIPPENVENANFIETGTLNPGTDFVTRAAPPVGTNPGGGIEVVTPPNGVTLNYFGTK